MGLREQLQEQIKEAMRARAAERLSGLRLISGAIKDREIALRAEGGTEVTEADILKLVESKALEETGWLQSELYTWQVEHIRM